MNGFLGTNYATIGILLLKGFCDFCELCVHISEGKLNVSSSLYKKYRSLEVGRGIVPGLCPLVSSITSLVSGGGGR